MAAVVVVLLVGCGWTAYSLLQARSTPVAVAAVPSVLSSPTPSATPLLRVLVHVLGAVRRPGLVELEEGGRVADAIALAGGLTAAADPGELNLAAVVADGSQLVIGTRGKPGGEVRGDGAGAGAGSGSAPAKVSLNTATLQQLDTLPGVGPVTAQRILDWREQHGRFNSVTELQEVDGIGPKTYADIAPNVRV
ncbi:MAG: helix-hairpin-helix domain-containing protein [Propionibacteriaceae bacterium]|nr:helix-hairpin-helix domain-containing protein [Propionibacteriaceae bacterium]